MSFNKSIQSTYQIQRNTISYANGFLQIIGKDENNLYVGGKSLVFKIPFNLNFKMTLFLQWKPNKVHHCNKGMDMFIQYMQEPLKGLRLIEVCGSSGCQQVCRSYDVKNSTFLNRYHGFGMVSTNKMLRTMHLIHGADVIVAVSSDNYRDGLISRHFNRSIIHKTNNPMTTSPFNALGHYVKFLNMFTHNDKTYFLFTEFSSELTNFYETFRSVERHKILSLRLGRICSNDVGIQSSKLFFTSFLKATLVCRRTVQISENWKSYVEYNEVIGASISTEDPVTITVLFRSHEAVDWNMTFNTVICQYSMHNIESQLAKSRLALLTKTDNASYWTIERLRRNLSRCYNSYEMLPLKSEYMVADSLIPISSPFLVRGNSSFGNPTSIDILRSVTIAITIPENNTIHLTMDIVFLATDKGFITRNILITEIFKKRFLTIKALLYFQNRFIMNDNQLRFEHFIQVFDHKENIESVVINKEDESLVVVGKSFVKRLPLGFCSNNCWSCNNNIDPFCQWNPLKMACEVRSLKEWNEVIKVYDCDAGRMDRSLKPIKDSTKDSFWIIFSLITFFSIFITVVAISIVFKYNFGNVSVFQHYKRTNNSKYYHSVLNKNSNFSTTEQKNSIAYSITSVNKQKSCRKSQVQQLNVVDKCKQSSHNSDSLVIENKNKETSSGKKNFMKIDINEFSNFCENQISSINVQENKILSSWKSCDAVLDFRHQTLEDIVQFCK